MDFHVDHIVDIVYLKVKWFADFEAAYRKRKSNSSVKEPSFDANGIPSSFYDSTNTEEYEEDEEEESFEFNIDDSEEQFIEKIVIKQEKEEIEVTEKEEEK